MIWISLLFPFLFGGPLAPSADLVLYNGKIYTVDSTFGVVEALAIKDGKILATGSSEHIRKQFQATRSVDLKGKIVYPGFIDAHCHFYGYALDLNKISLVDTHSFQEILDTLVHNKQRKYMGWLFARGWDQNDWADKSFPVKDQLDSLFPDIPVILMRIDGHAVLINQRAIRLLGLTENTYVPGGEVVKVNGKLTGLLIDNAIELVTSVLPNPSSGLIRTSLLQAQANCFAAGLTGVVDCGLQPIDVQRIDSIQQNGEIKMRVVAYLSDVAENFQWMARSRGLQTDFVKIAGFKFYADGALGSRGACLLKPYSDEAGHHGTLLRDPAYLRKRAAELEKTSLQMITHAIGDSANRNMLEIYGEVLPAGNDRRWRIEHAQVLDPSDFDLFGKYRIIPSVQPTHATSDMYWATDRLGKKRIRTAYAYRDLLQQNGWMPLGTDFPVEDISPLATFYAAVTRQDKKGWPAKGFQPKQALSREQALRGITIWAAKSTFDEDKKGSLEAGKWADLVILDTDLMTASPKDLLKAKVLSTVIAGQPVYGNW